MELSQVKEADFDKYLITPSQLSHFPLSLKSMY